MTMRGSVLALVVMAAPVATFAAEQAILWRDHKPQARLIPPQLGEPVKDIVDITVNGTLAEWCGWTLPKVTHADQPGLYIVVGDENNNSTIARLVQAGLKLDRADLSTEGFRILTYEAGDRRFIVITANSPVGLKHGCQELLFFRMSITSEGGAADWPLDVKMKPAFAYRGTYMLPCWSAYDSLENWKRVLKFHSELTLNRNWFWLAGFPLLEQYGGEYQKSDLANGWNVNALVELCRAEGMKFYIGGGWFTWHHEKIANKSIDRGIQWYLDMLELLPGTEGIYLEPPGEGREVDEKTWLERTEALARMARTIWKKRPEFEFAIAIGKFNDPKYRQAIHAIDDKRIYWWWCWGDPIMQNALAEHPLILRWHTTIQMSDYHGSTLPPEPREASLTGFATSYDPGQGYGNPWNGWPAMGHDKPRNVDPRTMPFFSHQYRFRERCWDLRITEEAFAARMARRLFDADMPSESIDHYLSLASMCPKPVEADQKQLAKITGFVDQNAGRGTPRNKDTLARMREAIDGILATRAKDSKPK
ncbi:MAG: hypothetical protein ACUVXJ_10635 [Phycisphaerae bacterium]